MANSPQDAPLLTVIIPVYNEASTIGTVMERVASQNIAGLKKEIIIVNDGSNDGSAPKIAELRKKFRCKVVSHGKNLGKGAAVLSALAQARGEYVLIQDADLEYDPKYYPSLLAPLIEGSAEVVFGSRTVFMGERYLLHHFGNRFLTSATNLLYGSHLLDMETGFKACRRSVLEETRLESRGFDFEPEFTAKVLLSGRRIAEVPIEFRARSFADGKKITVWDGIRALQVLLKLRIRGGRSKPRF